MNGCSEGFGPQGAVWTCSGCGDNGEEIAMHHGELGIEP